MPRRLIHEDGAVKVYEVTDADGDVIGTDVESQPTAEEANQRTIEDRMDQALSAMQTHVTRGTFTAAQRDAALLLVLRVCIGLVRVARRRFDATD